MTATRQRPEWRLSGKNLLMHGRHHRNHLGLVLKVVIFSGGMGKNNTGNIIIAARGPGFYSCC